MRTTRRLVLVVLVIGLLLGVAAVPIVRQWVTFRFRDHRGAPEVTEPFNDFDPTDPPAVRLAVAGDVGTGDANAHETGRAIDSLERLGDYDALLLLGDNVYPDGAPERLDGTVFGPFSAVLDGPTDLLAVLGNHDVRDDHADAHAAALGMPDRWYSTDIDGVLIVALDSTRPDDPAQLAWLEATLGETTATWKLVILHHPPFSGGFHGSSIDVRDAFGPLFEAHEVDLVFAGHDHDYQRSAPINGVTYVVSGGAAKLRPAVLVDGMETAYSVHHFVDVGIWEDRLVLQAVDQRGRQFDEVVLTD